MSALFPSLLNDKKSYTDKELEWFSLDTEETVTKEIKCPVCESTRDDWDVEDSCVCKRQKRQ